MLQDLDPFRYPHAWNPHLQRFPPTEHGDRVRYLALDPQALWALLHHLRTGTPLRLEGLPDDAALGAIGWDMLHGHLVLHVGSATFAPVPPGQPIPPLDLVIHTTPLSPDPPP